MNTRRTVTPVDRLKAIVAPLNFARETKARPEQFNSVRFIEAAKEVRKTFRNEDLLQERRLTISSQ